MEKHWCFDNMLDDSGGTHYYLDIIEGLLWNIKYRWRLDKEGCS